MDDPEDEVDPEDEARHQRLAELSAQIAVSERRAALWPTPP
jgi:hypothetical protein